MDNVENREEKVEKSEQSSYFNTHPEIYYG